MNRFFVDIDGRDIGTDIEITGGDVNHIKNVLRLKIGEEILVSDGRGRDYTCRISRIDPDKVVCNIEDISDNFAELPVKVTLFQGYPKSDKMDLIVQKMVELGVCRIVPVFTSRTIVKLDQKKLRKRQRDTELLRNPRRNSPDAGSFQRLQSRYHLPKRWIWRRNLI